MSLTLRSDLKRALEEMTPVARCEGVRPPARALSAGLLASLLILAGLASSARAGDRVYWANQFSPDTISFAKLDGSGGGDLSTAGAAANDGGARGVAIDVAAGKVYWTNRGKGRISFANLDGSGGGGDLNTAGATVNLPNAAAVYPAAGRIYWGNEGGNRISFARLDNSGGGDLITTDSPIAPAVNPGPGRIYWGNASPANKISFANLDGSGGGDLTPTGATVVNPHGVAIDPVAGRIYWANRGIATEQDRGQGIAWASLDGSGGGDFHPTGATVNVPVGVAIDPAARKIYWANWAENKISFANLDTGGGGDLPTPGATRDGSRSPVLLEAPSGVGAPAINGGSAAASALTCSPGSWAPDLLASWLYRAPQSVTYSWTRNGVGIPGASGNRYTASAGGDYRCTATASNPAGSSSQTSAAHAVAPPIDPPAVPPPSGPAAVPPPSGPPAVSPPSGPAAVSPRAFGVKTLVTMSVAALRTPSRGSVKVVVSDRNRFPVSGKLSVRTSHPRRLVISGKAFVVGARAKRSVTLKLSKTLRRLLKRERKLSLRLAAKVIDPAGNSRIVRTNVSLRRKGTA